MSSLKPLAIIYGVGPLLGLSLAKAFAPSHSLAIISRTLSHLTPLVQTLEKEVEGVEVRAFEADTDRGSLERAFGKIREEFRERRVDVGIWNAGGSE
jgi:short-subunit dehydrogenase